MDALEELRDVFMKVSVGLSGTMHLSEMTDGHRTLCGRLWWAENNHGDTYCRTCQSILSKRVSELQAVSSEEIETVICARCGEEYPAESKECTSCGLSREGRYNDDAENSGVPA